MSPSETQCAATRQNSGHRYMVSSLSVHISFRVDHRLHVCNKASGFGETTLPPAYLPACLPAYRPPTCRPSCRNTYLPTCLLALTTCSPACLPACPSACLPVCVPTSVHAQIGRWLPTHLPICASCFIMAARTAELLDELHGHDNADPANYAWAIGMGGQGRNVTRSGKGKEHAGERSVGEGMDVGKREGGRKSETYAA
eukprot:1653921-Pleurochrysis_carterae.AAC.1